ncbi:MAG: hypothetical protein CVV49_13995 [Spirochaetae bacterium HGW-Spirochaetae-5]|nr:MAG: hypothetical protein CVV49_13995 [Spirochaetae bacterium HGW-Spirochaetae-5]
MKILNPDQIRIFLGQVTYGRALSYFRSGKVTEIWEEDNLICGHVQGSDFEPYYVVVDPVTLKNECECPMRHRCKHVGALLLEYASRPVEKKEEVPLTIPDPVEKITEIILDMNKKRELYNPLFYNEKSEIKGSDPQQRFKVVFFIDTAFYQNGRVPVVVPKMQYIKKDGSPGRIEDYKSIKVTEPVTESQNDLLEMAAGYNGGMAPVHRLLPFLLKHSDIEIFEIFEKEFKRVEFVEFGNIEISFRLYTITERNDPSFKPLYHLHTPDRGEFISETLHVAGDTLLCRLPGMVLYNSKNKSMIQMSWKILNYTGTYYPNNIDNLKKLAKSDPEAEISVNFPHTRIVKIKGGGKPVLDIESYAGYTLLELNFDYRGREFPYGRVETILNLDHLNQSGDIFHIAERDMDYENSVLRFIRNVVEVTGTQQQKFRPHEYERIFEGKILYKQNLDTFLLTSGEKLLNQGISLRLKKNNQKIIRSGGKVAFKVKTNIDWFDVEALYVDESGEETRIDVGDAILKSRLIKTSGGYAYISGEDITRLVTLNHQQIDKKGTLKIHKLDFSAVESISSAIDERDKAAVENTLRTYEKLKDVKAIGKYPLPVEFNGKLRPYQAEGYNWLCFLREFGLNGCLADDMGLGKTVQTLALLQKLKENGKLRPVLLVVPVSTIPNWEQEISRFTPGITYIRHIGQFRSEDAGDILNHDVTITSYHTLRNDIKILSEIDFTLLVLDEAQNIKNAATKAFKAVKTIKAEQTLALSGTPVENNTGELWALFDLLNPGLLGTKDFFQKKFSGPIEKSGDTAVAERLRAIIFPFILRRKKEMVAKELPPKEEIIVYCEMGSGQRKIYDSYKNECRSKIQGILSEKGKERGAIEIFDALLKLRQIALFPSLVSDEFESAGSCKFDLFRDMFDEILAEGHKVLVFSQFVKSLKIIEADIVTKNLKYSYIDGSTKKRDVEIKKFQDDASVNIFLLSLKAGGVGINLTSADYVILFDPWWNPAVEAQAVDRAHRIGQTRKVTAYKLIVKDTVEEKILKLQEKKKALVRDLISEEASFFKSLSGDDIINLFE